MHRTNTLTLLKTQNKWSTLTDMPVACHHGAAVTLNDFIYVVGGNSKICLKYHPALDTWTTLSQPKQKHGLAPAVVWRGSILLAVVLSRNRRRFNSSIL